MDNQLTIEWEKSFGEFYKKLLVKPKGFYTVHSKLKAKARGNK